MQVKAPPAMDVERARRSKRIAIVYSRTPLPMHRADQLTVAHLIAYLYARGHAVDLYAIDSGATADAEDRRWLAEHCNDVKFFKHSWQSIAAGVLGGLLRGRPIQVGLFTNKQQRAELGVAVGRGDYDLVYTYYIRSGEVGRDLPAGPSGRHPVTFLAMQLSQALNTRRIVQNPPNLLYKVFYWFENRMLQRYEGTIWSKFNRVVLIGEKDVASVNAASLKYSSRVPDNIVRCAHGVDTHRFRPRDAVAVDPFKLVFSGVMRTPTNVQAAQWFVRNVMPLLTAAEPRITLDIVGRDPTQEVRALDKVAGVHVLGTVPDTAIPIASAAICINPMQAGGGMQNKLIEYLSSGKATVATSVANEGIGATPGRDLLIADDPASFAEAILDLLRDDRRRHALESAARAYIMREWSWEAQFLKLEEAFDEALSVDCAEGADIEAKQDSTCE